jgi:hypothetical protein
MTAQQDADTPAETLRALPTAWFRNTWSWEPDAAPLGSRARRRNGPQHV